MYRQSYADILADSTLESRSIERLALEKAIAKLTAAAPADPGSAEENEALDFTTKREAITLPAFSRTSKACPDPKLALA